MSKLNGSVYSSERQDWMTPVWIVLALLLFEGLKKFGLDPCCTSKNIPALRHYTCLSLERLWHLDWHWNNLVFMNPPYGKMLKLFLKKAYRESLKGSKVWALIPARTETIYQHEYGITKAGFTVFLKGRLHFLQDGEDKGAAPFPTMLLYYGDDAKEKAARWLENPPIPGTLMTIPEFKAD